MDNKTSEQKPVTVEDVLNGNLAIQERELTECVKKRDDGLAVIGKLNSKIDKLSGAIHALQFSLDKVEKEKRGDILVLPSESTPKDSQKGGK